MPIPASSWNLHPALRLDGVEQKLFLQDLYHNDYHPQATAAAAVAALATLPFGPCVCAHTNTTLLASLALTRHHHSMLAASRAANATLGPADLRKAEPPRTTPYASEASSRAKET